MPASVIDRSAIDCLSSRLAELGATRTGCGPSHRSLRDSLEKTGRRLTSDPIRTSLGLLPSGPDPVGEWLVHRQSPGPYLGPKAPESKREPTAFAGLVREHGKALVAVMPGLVPGIHVFLNVARGWRGIGVAEATPSFERLCPAMTNHCRITAGNACPIPPGR